MKIVASEHAEHSSAVERLKGNKKKQPVRKKNKSPKPIATVKEVKEEKPKNNIVEKRKKPAAFAQNDPDVIEQNLEKEMQRQEEEYEKRSAAGSFIAKALKVVMAASCIYLIFLIYGVLMTDFVYDKDGAVVPQVLSVEDISEKKKYQIILAQYEKCRILYENTLMLDYRLGQGIEDPLQIATEYERLIKDPADPNNMENLYKKTGAMVVDTKYTQVRELMLLWLDDMGNYLGNMSVAITNNNEEAKQEAVVYRENVYNNFYILTQNIVSLGENIEGIDLYDVKEWAPDKYIDETINGTAN